MTEQQINQALAEALGWTNTHPDDPKHGWWMPAAGFGSAEYHPYPPDYCNDLNAVASARAALTEAEQPKFHGELCVLVFADRPIPPFNCVSFHLIDSTPLLQSQALLSVLRMRQPQP